MHELQPNDTVCNRYRVTRKLGAGAMGSVYLCEDAVESNIKVALKVLVSENIDDQDLWAKGEYEALTRLRHPNLARVYNFGRIGDSRDYFIVSEFIKGIDLFSATEYLNYDELADIIVQICRALEYIHCQGYVHFDIKPDNILVTRYKTVGLREGSKVQYNESDLASSKRSMFAKPNVKLIDFGLAEKITGSFNFAIKGTLNYLAPEILGGQTPDKRADLYSLGVTLYQVANRDLPFYHDVGDALSGGQTSKRSDLFSTHMKKHPEYLRLLILRLLEEAPERRFQSAKEVIQFINRHTDYKFDVETPETRASYFYSPKIVGRRRELNLLKEYHERCFFPSRWRDRAAQARARAEEKKDSPEDNAADGAGAGVEAELEAMAPATEHSFTVDCPALLLVSGEMGAGKSRLLEEFQHYLKLNDQSLVVGNCYEANNKAYQPVIEALRQLTCALGPDSELGRKYRQDVLKLLPELRTRRDDEDGLVPGFRPDKEKLYFIERICQLLIDYAQSSPYVLVINNLHWVDEASLELLDKLVTRLAEMRARGEDVAMLVIASLRPDEVLLDGSRDLLDRLRKNGQCLEIPIRRMKRSHIQEYLCAMLGFTEVPDAFVTKLEERTGGNPLYIIETLKALQDDGVLRNQGDGWAIKATNYDRIEIPQSMEDLLEKRLSRLGSRKREILEVLSALDRPANPKFLQSVKSFESTPIHGDLRDLEQSGLISKAFDSTKLLYQITQPKVREILYARTPDDRRRRFHGEIAAAWLEAYKGKEEEILEEVAYHLQRSDQADKAIEMAIRAGDRLKAIYANERAYEYYMYVLEKIEGASELQVTWADTQEKLGDLCTTMGRYDMADRSYAVLLGEDMRKLLGPKRAVKLFLSRGRIFEIQGDYEQALKCFKDARNFLSTFDRKELVVERIRVFNSIGWVYVCMGKYEKAMAISLEASRVIEGQPERIEHALVYNTIGSANYYKGNIREAIDYHRRSLQIREHLENIPEITSSLNNLGAAHMAGTEYGEAFDLFQRALRTSEEIGDPYGRAITLHNFARLYFAVGQTDKGWEALEESLQLSKRYNMRYLNTQNYIVRGQALRDQGDYNKAEGNLFRALSAFSKQGNRWGLCTILLQLAELHRLSGHLKEARAMIDEGKQYAEDLDIHSLRGQYRLAEARLVREESESGCQDALKLLEEGKSLADKTGHPELVGEVHYEIGETMVRLRRLRDAPDHYKIAEEKTREVFESLPEAFREAYTNKQRQRFRDWKAPPKLSQDSPAASDGAKPQKPAKSFTAEDSLRRMNELMVTLCAGGTLQAFLARVLDEILLVLDAEAAFLLRLDGHDLSVDASRAAAGKTLADPERMLSLDLIEKVVDGKKPILLADAADDPAIARLLDDHGLPQTALAVVAFPSGPGRESVLYVINPQLPRGGGQQSLWLIQPFLNLVPLATLQLRVEPVATR